MNNVATMPNEIAAAIIKVMGGVKKLKREDKNTHGGYNFVSIDDFLEAVNPLCFEAGLFFLLSEAEAEVIPNGNKTPNLRVAYDITIGHSSGQTLNGIRKNVTVLANGAQAYGTAQSYALKQTMRSLFQIPTGDKDDPDFQNAEELAGSRTQAQERQPAGKNKTTRELYSLFQGDIDAADSVDALEIWHTQHLSKVQTLPEDWRAELKSRYLTKMQELTTEKENAA